MPAIIIPVLWVGGAARGRLVRHRPYGPLAVLYRLLRTEAEPSEGPSFSPEEVTQLTEAYEFVLASLELRDRDDPITEIIAKKIIDLFAFGERDTLKIHDRAIKELGVTIRDRS